MTRAPNEQWLRGLPKAELHMHLEGSLEPEMLFAFAARNGVALPFRSVDEVRAAYQFERLDDFLKIYYQGMAVLRTEQDFHELALAYLRRVHRDGVRHVEVFFDPQGHTSRGVPFGTVVRGITGALAEGEAALGISSRLIMSFLRHLPEEDAFATLAQAEPHLEHIAGVGLDSSELPYPPANFARVFKAAHERGLHLVAHAGEEGPPEYVRDALDVLHVERIDHGNRALEDPVLVQRLRELGMTLTVCPLSNLRLCGVHELAAHPLKRMLDLGLAATVNSDDPAYFGGYMHENMMAVASHLPLTRGDFAALARNSFRGSFLPPEQIAGHLEDIERHLAADVPSAALK